MSPARAPRLPAWLPTSALAAICYIPLLLTHRGEVGADTKSYLYLDPSRLLERAWSMWDPNVGLGTVTHQNIGYLWPMGPWFWFFQQIGSPDWVAQRLWLGTILFLAGLGVRYLMRTLGQHGLHVSAAMFIYALSPYVLTLAARISALLLPFVGLPWMLGLIIRATRQRGWLYPALFALLIPTIGSTNATALILAGLGPVLWLPFAVFVLGEITVRQALGVLARLGVLSLGTSLWWIAGLYAQGAFGLDVLAFSETAKTVADPATAPELLRGLGYWFFYGDDKLGPWIEPSVPYTQNLALIAVTYLVACIGLLSAGFVRWRYRTFFVGLIVMGLVVGVGAHPWNDPPLWGKGVKAFLLSNVGLAMRSLPRAVPLITLGLAVLAGMGVASIAAWSQRMARPLALGVMALAVGALPPLWTGNMVARNLQRPEKVPIYWEQATHYLDTQGRGQGAWATRVLEVPGSDFGSYRWGNTVDPITPGLMDRPLVARELIPYGTPVSADLLNAIDGPMQEGLLPAAAVAPIARFMAVGDIDLRGDLQYERFNLARPRQLAALLKSAPGLGPAVGFGGNAPNVPEPSLPLIDELELASPPDLPDPSKVTVYPVKEPEPILRLLPGDRPVIVAGSGQGLVDAAGAGVLTGRELVLYSGSLAGDHAALGREVGQSGATLLLTDTNRRSATRWSTVNDNNGYTEEAGEKPLSVDLGDSRLPIFPDATDDSYTVAEQRGGVHAQATGYGNPVTYTSESRAANAVDNDLDTGWSVGAFSNAEHERIELTYDRTRSTDRVTLVQAAQGVQNRWITRVRLRFDDGHPLDVDLAPASRSNPGQSIGFPRRSFKKLSVEILADDAGHRDRYDNLSSVGFNDIRLGDGDRRLDEVIRLPRDLLEVSGQRSAEDPLTVVLTRLRSRPTAPVRTDPEESIVRTFSLPTARDFRLSGVARLATRAPGPTIDKLLGVTAADGSAIRATESRRLAGDISARAISAIDGDAATHFSPGFLNVKGDFVDYRLAKPITFDHMNLQVLNDGRHSVPTRLRIDADGRTAATVTVPPVADQSVKDGTVTVPIRFPRVKGVDIRVTIDSVREVTTNDWVSKLPVAMPVGLAELGIPGLRARVPTGRFDSGCRSDLLSVDDTAVNVRVTGSVADAVGADALKVFTCGSRSVALRDGHHLIRSVKGKTRGIDLDQLVLTSDSADGRSSGDTPAGDQPLAGLNVTRNQRDHIDLKIGARRRPSWLVLGQSHSLGWKATAGGRDLGPATPVNGYANGWLLPAGAAVQVSLEWTPQRIVSGALAGSALAVLICLLIVLVALRRRRRGPHRGMQRPGDQPAAFAADRFWRSAGAAPSVRATLVTTVLFGVAGGAVIGPIAGMVVAAAALATLHWRAARIITTIGPAALLAVSALYIMVIQFRHDLPAGFGWAGYFTEVHQVAYVGVALLALEVVVDRLWTQRWWPRTDTDQVTEAHNE